MQRIYWLFALVIALGLAVFAITKFSGDRAQGTRMVADRDFKVADPDVLSKIFIVDRVGNANTLTRNGDSWTFNGKYEANENVMKNLLDAITKIEMQYIPANAAVPNIVKNLATEGIRVDLFDRSGDKIKSYYIGGSTPDERGTFAIMEGAEQPYVVHIPHWVGNLRFRFNLKYDQWRTRKLFEEDIDQISLVSVEYPTQRNNSFVLERKGDGYQVGPYYETGQAVREVPRGRAEGYLVKLEEGYVSAYFNAAVEEKAALIRRIPFATLRIERKDGSEMAMKIFPRASREFDALDPNTDAAVSQMREEGFNLLLNDDADFATAQNPTIQPLLISYDSF